MLTKIFVTCDENPKSFLLRGLFNIPIGGLCVDTHLQQNHAWIEAFKQKHQRAPRILHLGNICNNAYHTAKMLNAAGADCDVLCADYYYIMGCPEWDDSSVKGDLGNLYYPLLHLANTGGFTRPLWFAQAPTPLAIKYLIAKRKNHTGRAKRLWQKMAKTRRRIAEEENGLSTFLTRQHFFLKRLHRFYLKTISLADYFAQVAKELFTKPKTFFKRVLLRLGRLGQEDVSALAKLDEDTALARKKAQYSANVSAQVLQQIYKDAAQLFPDRQIIFSQNITAFFVYLNAYKKLFAHYDIVQAYAVEVVWPYLAGIKNYVAYEHGTLRDTVFENGDTQKLALLAYARAAAVYVTNLDCYEKAQYITKHSHAPIVCGLHGIDMAAILQKMQIAKKSLEPKDRFNIPKDIAVFFCPSRHTFVPQQNSFLKGEDKAICAAARLAKEGANFRLVFAQWGQDVDKIKALISTFPPLDGKVLWTAPLAKSQFYKALLCATAVLDQFYLQAYGGIGFETLCSGSSVLISSRPQKEEYVGLFFKQPLPYLSCNTEDEIYSAMKSVLCDVQKTALLAGQGRQWVQNCHSQNCIVQCNLQAYQLVLPLNLPQKGQK